MRLPLVYWLVGAALLANGAAWYWRTGLVHAPEPVKLTAFDNTERLVLLKELEVPRDQGELLAAAKAAAAVLEGNPDDFAEERMAELQPVALEPSRNESSGLSESRSKDAETSSLVAAGIETVAAQVDDEAHDEGDDTAGSRDQARAEALIEEGAAAARASLPDALPDESGIAARQPQPQVPALADPDRCWLVGPVQEGEASEPLLAAFAGAGVSLDLVLRTVEISPDHWVYMPTRGSQADIRRLSRQLRQSGIDNFPITDGPLVGSLSLGLFRSEERANSYRDAIVERGYAVEIYQRPAFAEQPWAAIDDAGRRALGWPEQAGQLPDFETLLLAERECLP